MWYAPRPPPEELPPHAAFAFLTPHRFSQQPCRLHRSLRKHRNRYRMEMHPYRQTVLWYYPHHTPDILQPSVPKSYHIRYPYPSHQSTRYKIRHPAAWLRLMRYPRWRYRFPAWTEQHQGRAPYLPCPGTVPSLSSRSFPWPSANSDPVRSCLNAHHNTAS